MDDIASHLDEFDNFEVFPEFIADRPSSSAGSSDLPGRDGEFPCARSFGSSCRSVSLAVVDTAIWAVDHIRRSAALPPPLSSPSLPPFAVCSSKQRAMPLLLNANEWKRLIEGDLPRSKRIDLNISPEENPWWANDVLLPFHNSFSIDEKCCRFVCLISAGSETCVRLFTVPYFHPRETWYPPLARLLLGEASQMIEVSSRRMSRRPTSSRSQSPSTDCASADLLPLLPSPTSTSLSARFHEEK